VTKADKVWIVEGIFDAIALGHAGIAAISAMSSVNYPGHTLADLFPAQGCRPHWSGRSIATRPAQNTL
jgi:hypothetical protein